MPNNNNLPSTQEHLDIVDIVEEYVILKNGACAVVEPSAVNFDLLSEREQDALISVYAGFLNSLTFPIQVVVRTKKVDLSQYIEQLEKAHDTQPNQFLQQKIRNYKEFIQRLTARKDVLDKRFYVVIPYRSTTLEKSGGGLFSFLKRGKKKPNTAKILKKARNHLEPKVDHVIKQLSRLGVGVKALNHEELVELYYDIYNPQVSHFEHIGGSAGSYTSPLIEPDIEEQL